MLEEEVIPKALGAVDRGRWMPFRFAKPPFGGGVTAEIGRIQDFFAPHSWRLECHS
jgi:hypothetical protein